MINDTFNRVKTKLELNDTFSDTVSRQHNAVRGVVENNGQSVQDTKLIGSLHQLRQTRIQPRESDRFDIDVLVVLGAFYSWLRPGDPTGVTPAMAMNYVHSIMNNSPRYGAMAPQQDHPTITFEYANNVKVELVPAYKDNIGHSPNGVQHQPTGRAYWIPNSGGGWDLADYDYEAQYISGVNQQTGGLFIPTVKMLKAIKREHFPSMKSFHLEVIAALTIPGIMAYHRQHGTVTTYPALIASFLNMLDSYVANPQRIPGSNSPAFQVDPMAQLEIAQKLPALKQQSRNALLVGSDSDKHTHWRGVFGEVFPLS